MVDTRIASAISRTVRSSCWRSLTVVTPCPRSAVRPDPLHRQQSTTTPSRCNANRCHPAGNCTCGDGLGGGADLWLSAEVPVPVDERCAEQYESHRAGREKRPEWDLLLAAPDLYRDQGHTDDGAVEEAGEQTARDLAPAQPPEAEAEKKGKPHVAEAHASRRHDVNDVEDRERHRAGSGGSHEGRPVVLERGPDREQDNHRAVGRVQDAIREDVVLEVYRRQRDESAAEHQVSVKRPRMGESGTDRREQHRGEQLDERVTRGDRRST